MSLTARELTCVRGDRLVFQDLSFDVMPGQVTLVRGPNGVGKSSLLRCCADLVRPVAGRLMFGDRPIGEDPEAYRAEICYLGHLDALKPVLTVRENLQFWQRLAGGDDAGPNVGQAIDRLGLGDRADWPVRYLSAGQRRRANLARLAASRATLWLLDEPTTSLDWAGIDIVVDLLTAHSERGGMALVATHGDLAVAGASELQLRFEADAGAVG